MCFNFVQFQGELDTGLYYLVINIQDNELTKAELEGTIQHIEVRKQNQESFSLQFSECHNFFWNNLNKCVSYKIFTMRHPLAD